MGALAGLVLVAAGCWLVMFSPWTAGLANFWLLMTLSAGTLAVGALLADRRRLAEAYRFEPAHAVVGVLSAALLYGLFYAGNALSTWLLPFAGAEIGGIYAIRTEAPPALVGALLLLWIGPAEEVFWRGFVQRRLAERWGPVVGLLAATAIYTLVHAWAGNLMLLGAAGLCSLFWGLLYLRFRSVWPGLISHALWDLVIFVLLPVA